MKHKNSRTKRKTPARDNASTSRVQRVIRPPRGAKIPHYLFSCAEDHCREQQSWPAEDMFWVAKAEGWYCTICIDDMPEDFVRGISLADWLREIGQPA